jgi:ion channel POLLUX/CASTOR
MQPQYPFRERARYWFDNTLSRGPIALIGWLALASVVVIAIAAIIVVIFGIAPAGENQPGFFEAAWMSLMRTLDAGTMGGDAGWGFRFVMFAVTLGGVFVISTLIGILTTGMENKVDELRKGRSKVLEANHTVILGWSEHIFTIIAELVIANENHPDSCIAILSEQDKVEMEDAIRDKLRDTGNTRVICRTGSPLELSDLELVSPQTSRAIIILAPEDDDPDSQVIKTILAITNSPNRRKEPYHIVAALCDPKNLEVARMVGKDEVELILVSDLIERVIAQTCRQSGLSVVYTELLDFGGDEIYFKVEPSLAGKTFGETFMLYEDSTVIGLQPTGKAPLLKPPCDMRLQPGDQIIAISEDDDTIKLSGLTDYKVNQAAVHTAEPTPPAPERTLILGWNSRASGIINQLDCYVAVGSEIMVIADSVEVEQKIERHCLDLQHERVVFQQGDTTDRRTLNGLQVERYDHVIVLSDDALPAQKTDARTLITLLHLRDMQEKQRQDFAIVSEMLDIRNRNLAEVTQADDYIVSNNLISLMLTQVAENKALNAIFADIFDPEGAEIYLKPARNYVQTGIAVNFYTVVEAARRRGEIAIGYKRQQYAKDVSHAYGVTVNPKKSEMMTFTDADRIIVVAED